MGKPKKVCGSCFNWTKWKENGRGLCDKLDCAGKSDDGKNCKHWKGIKYNRIETDRQYN